MVQLPMVLWYRQDSRKDQETNCWWPHREQKLQGRRESKLHTALYRQAVLISRPLYNCSPAVPYDCQNWEDTEFCSNSCEYEPKRIQTRECVSIQPGVSLKELGIPLITTGNITCENSGMCAGGKFEILSYLLENPDDVFCILVLFPLLDLCVRWNPSMDRVV